MSLPNSLKTIKEIRIKSPIARAALPNIIKRMAIQHTKVEIWINKKKKHIIYNNQKTIFLLGFQHDETKKTYFQEILSSGKHIWTYRLLVMIIKAGTNLVTKREYLLFITKR